MTLDDVTPVGAKKRITFSHSVDIPPPFDAAKRNHLTHAHEVDRVLTIELLETTTSARQVILNYAFGDVAREC